MAFVVASEYRKRSERPSEITVRVSSSPSRTLGRRAGVAILEAPREILELASSGRDLGLHVGSHDDHADPRPLALRQVLQDVAEFVHLTPVNQGSRPQCLDTGRVARPVRSRRSQISTATGTSPSLALLIVTVLLLVTSMLWVH